MDYDTLIAAKTTAGSLANWANSAQVVSSAPTIIDEAQSYVYRRLRHWRMLTETSGTMTAGAANDSIDISGITNYLEDKMLMFVGVPNDANGAFFKQRIKRRDPEFVWSLYAYDSSGNRVQALSSFYYSTGTQLKLQNPADYNYPWKLQYWAQPTALSGANTTNWLTTYYPRAFRCALTVGVCEFMKDAGMGNFDRAYWDMDAEKEIALAQIETARITRSDDSGAYIPGTE